MPPGPHALGRRAQQLELELGQRLRAPAQVGPRGEHAEPGARRVDERAVEARQLRRQRRGRRRARRARSSRRAGATFSSSSRARASFTSTATTSPASIVALPPGAAQRSSMRSPSLRADGEAGELRAAALRPDRAPPRAPARRPGRRASAPGMSGSAPAVDLAADEPDDGLRRLVLRAHQRERLVRARARATSVSATQSGYECSQRASSGVASGSASSSARDARRRAGAARRS